MSVTSRRHPALAQLAAVAAALGPLRDHVVFIGGAIAPALQTDPPFPRARPTSDVDAVAISPTYSDSHRLSEELRARGFRRAVGDTRNAHRWYSPDNIAFDLVPAGEQLGASGNLWDSMARDTAVEVELEPGLIIRHASAPAFLALKWAAHDDRGRADPLASHDLEDILALLASRPIIRTEIGEAPLAIRTYLADRARAFLDDSYMEDLLAAHLNNAQDPSRAIAAVRELIEWMASNPRGSAL
ncbi:MAG: hypothetical protein AABY85_01110 [Gemmatimonadota bacterium]